MCPVDETLVAGGDPDPRVRYRLLGNEEDMELMTVHKRF